MPITLFIVRLSAAVLILLLTAGQAQAAIVWHWQDEFSLDEKHKLADWVQRTVTAVEHRVAPYPFDVHVFFHRMAGRGEPVPWANTERGAQQGVNLHVDASYPLQKFLDDWTAPHELSHLLLPYVGERNAWFAEGFASFMQYQVMNEMGVLSREQMLSEYRSHIHLAARRFDLNELPFAQAALVLREQFEFPTYYWGGAVYFLQIDRELQSRQSSLTALLARYLQCCRTQPQNLDKLIAQLDKLAGAPLFHKALQTMRTRPGFPVWAGLLEPAGG